LEEYRNRCMDGTAGALRWGRALVVCGLLLCLLGIPLPGRTANDRAADGMTVDEAAKLGEDFGVIVGDVDEAIQKELKLQRPQGVAVFEVIGNSRADYAGIKVRSVIKEIDKKEVRNMLDFGRHIKKAINECNFTVGTYEPADPGDPVGWGVNFHFVGCKRD
ncbi:MAG TPA: PDZ domain-containing protein, partial [Nitrospira sp.]|nr:PDZ domain-containing protein [Nitrospira sp.]